MFFCLFVCVHACSHSTLYVFVCLPVQNSQEVFWGSQLKEKHLSRMLSYMHNETRLIKRCGKLINSANMSLSLRTHTCSPPFNSLQTVNYLTNQDGGKSTLVSPYEWCLCVNLFRLQTALCLFEFCIISPPSNSDQIVLIK